MLNLQLPLNRERLDKLSQTKLIRFDNFYPEGFLDLLRRKKDANELVHSDCLRSANVFGTDRYKTFLDAEINSHLLKLDRQIGLRTTYHSILRYKPGAFAKMHPDRPGTLTVVTLLEQHECEGGEMIIFDDHSLLVGKSHWSDDPAERKKNTMFLEAHTEDQMVNWNLPNIVPVVTNFKHVEESIMYPTADKTSHGVARIRSGERVVFIHWMDRNA